ncbi:MAG: NUDIX domain-containing protein [Candidatus Zapsychrus exili]|nr:NUDIX domain-containing protein [Candidatus Zapsychrus exili]
MIKSLKEHYQNHLAADEIYLREEFYARYYSYYINGLLEEAPDESLGEDANPNKKILNIFREFQSKLSSETKELILDHYKTLGFIVDKEYDQDQSLRYIWLNQIKGEFFERNERFDIIRDRIKSAKDSVEYTHQDMPLYPSINYYENVLEKIGLNGFKYINDSIAWGKIRKGSFASFVEEIYFSSWDTIMPVSPIFIETFKGHKNLKYFLTSHETVHAVHSYAYSQENIANILDDISISFVRNSSDKKLAKDFLLRMTDVLASAYKQPSQFQVGSELLAYYYAFYITNFMGKSIEQKEAEIKEKGKDPDNNLFFIFYKFDQMLDQETRDIIHRHLKESGLIVDKFYFDEQSVGSSLREDATVYFKSQDDKAMLAGEDFHIVANEILDELNYLSRQETEDDKYVLEFSGKEYASIRHMDMSSPEFLLQYRAQSNPSIVVFPQVPVNKSFIPEILLNEGYYYESEEHKIGEQQQYNYYITRRFSEEDRNLTADEARFVLAVVADDAGYSDAAIKIMFDLENKQDIVAETVLKFYEIITSSNGRYKAVAGHLREAFQINGRQFVYNRYFGDNKYGLISEHLLFAVKRLHVLSENEINIDEAMITNNKDQTVGDFEIKYETGSEIGLEKIGEWLSQRKDVIDKKPVVIVLTGRPAGGKSTLVKAISKAFLKSQGVDYDPWQHTLNRINGFEALQSELEERGIYYQNEKFADDPYDNWPPKPKCDWTTAKEKQGLHIFEVISNKIPRWLRRRKNTLLIKMDSPDDITWERLIKRHPDMTAERLELFFSVISVYDFPIFTPKKPKNFIEVGNEKNQKHEKLVQAFLNGFSKVDDEAMIADEKLKIPFIFNLTPELAEKGADMYLSKAKKALVDNKTEKARKHYKRAYSLYIKAIDLDYTFSMFSEDEDRVPRLNRKAERLRDELLTFGFDDLLAVTKEEFIFSNFYKKRKGSDVSKSNLTKFGNITTASFIGEPFYFISQALKRDYNRQKAKVIEKCFSELNNNTMRRGSGGRFKSASFYKDKKDRYFVEITFEQYGVAEPRFWDMIKGNVEKSREHESFKLAGEEYTDIRKEGIDFVGKGRGFRSVANLAKNTRIAIGYERGELGKITTTLFVDLEPFLKKASDKAMIADKIDSVFIKNVDKLDWVAAKEVERREIVRNIEDESILETQNQKNYFANNIDIREMFLEFLMNEKYKDFDVLKEHLLRWHKTLIMGKDGNSIYTPNIMSEEEAIEQAGKFDKIISIEAIDKKVKNIQKDIIFFMEFDPGSAYPLEVVEAVNRVFESFHKDLWLFKNGNNSLYMNIVNAMLRLHGLKSISHYQLDAGVKGSPTTRGLGVAGIKLDKNDPTRNLQAAVFEANPYLIKSSDRKYLIEEAKKAMPSVNSKEKNWTHFNKIIEILRKRKDTEVAVIGGVDFSVSENPLIYRIVDQVHPYGSYVDALESDGFKVILGSAESVFLKHIFDNILYQHVRSSLVFVIKERYANYNKITIVDNGEGFKDKKDQYVLILDAIKRGNSFGDGGDLGTGFTQVFNSGVDYISITGSKEWVILEGSNKNNRENFMPLVSGKEAAKHGTVIEGYFLNNNWSIFNNISKRRIRKTFSKDNILSVGQSKKTFEDLLGSSKDQAMIAEGYNIFDYRKFVDDGYTEYVAGGSRLLFTLLRNKYDKLSELEIYSINVIDLNTRQAIGYLDFSINTEELIAGADSNANLNWISGDYGLPNYIKYYGVGIKDMMSIRTKDNGKSRAVGFFIKEEYRNNPKVEASENKNIWNLDKLLMEIAFSISKDEGVKEEFRILPTSKKIDYYKNNYGATEMIGNGAWHKIMLEENSKSFAIRLGKNIDGKVSKMFVENSPLSRGVKLVRNLENFKSFIAGVDEQPTSYNEFEYREVVDFSPFLFSADVGKIINEAIAEINRRYHKSYDRKFYGRTYDKVSYLGKKKISKLENIIEKLMPVYKEYKVHASVENKGQLFNQLLFTLHLDSKKEPEYYILLETNRDDIWEVSSGPWADEDIKGETVETAVKDSDFALMADSEEDIGNTRTLDYWRNHSEINIIEGGKEGITPEEEEIEALRVVDKKGSVYKNVYISKKHAHQRGFWHQTAHVYAFYKGKLLIHKRSNKKDTSKNKLQVSFGGHVDFEDKSLKDAAQREGSEESGIKLDEKRLIQVSDINAIRREYKLEDGFNREFSTIFIYELNDSELKSLEKNYNINEIDEFWLLPFKVFEEMTDKTPNLFSRSLNHIVREGRDIYETIKQKAVQSDNALMAEEVGGIDFNTSELEIKEMGEKIEFDVNIDIKALENATGFVPVIINITPITNLPMFLGLNNKEKLPKQELASKDMAYLKP